MNTTTTYTVFHGGSLFGTGNYSGPGIDIRQALRDAAQCAREVGGEPMIVADDTGRHVRFVDGLGWVEMPEEYDAAEVTAADCRNDCQLRVVAEDGEELEDDETPSGWVDTADERIAIYWENGVPCAVSVTDFDCGNQIEEDWLVALLREETGLDVELAGDAGHWNPGEGEGEAIRSIVAR